MIVITKIMANIKTVEELVQSFIDKDLSKVVVILDKEIELAKKNNNNTVARRLRNLIIKIRPTSGLFAQSLGAMNNITDDKLDLLIERAQMNFTLNDVVLDTTTTKIVEDIIKEWADYDKLAEYNIYPTNRILFYGPPGTGKTKLAYALSKALDRQLIIVKLDELVSAFLGKTGKNIRDIFELAKREPIVLLLDEIDTIAKHRDDNKELGELKRVVTVLLQNIDNFPSNSILIGATNHENLLDQAIWRRFPLKLKFDLPDKDGRKKLFNLFLRDFKNKINFGTLAELSEGFSGSLIFDVCSYIKKQAILNNNSIISDIDSIKGLLFFSNPNVSNVKVTKKYLYKMCRILKNNNYTLNDISHFSNIPYTTLRDNIK